MSKFTMAPPVMQQQRDCTCRFEHDIIKNAAEVMACGHNSQYFDFVEFSVLCLRPVLGNFLRRSFRDTDNGSTAYKTYSGIAAVGYTLSRESDQVCCHIQLRHGVEPDERAGPLSSRQTASRLSKTSTMRESDCSFRAQPKRPQKMHV